MSNPAQPVKLTKWSNEPSITDLKSDLELGRNTQKIHLTDIDRWNDILYTRGKSAPIKIEGRSAMQPKLVRRQAEWRYSALSEPFLSTDRLFKLYPVTFEDQEAAEQNELILNHQFRTKLNLVDFIDNYVRSTVDDGTCLVWVGWNREVELVKKQVPVYDFYPIESEEQLQILEEAITLKQSNPRGYDENIPEEIKEAVSLLEETGEYSIAVQVGTEEVEEEEIKENSPTVEIQEPGNVIIDPSCRGDISKAKFVIRSFETSKSELMKSKKQYKNLDKVNWNSASVATTPDHNTKTPNDSSFNDESRKVVVAYEYWGYYDIYNKGILYPIVATWLDNVIIRMELNPFPDGKPPCVLVKYSPKKRELYGEADAELLEDNQKVIGALTRGIIDSFGRVATGQRGFAKGMLDPLNRRRLNQGQDYDFNPNIPVSSGYVETKFPEIPQSAFALLQHQNQEAEGLVGVKAFSGGMSGEAYGKVAAGIRGMLDAASKREMAILRRLAKGIIDIGTKITAMNAIFLTEKEVVRVTNKKFITVYREDLKGNFDIQTDIATAEVDNAQAEDLSFMLQTIGNTMDFGMTKKLLAKIAELKRMPDLAEEIKQFQPEPTPQEQEMAELEMELKRKEVEKLQSEIDLNNARARKELAQSESTELDSIATSTGLKHERAMEQQQAQARGNQNLEITKALTKPRKEGEPSPNIDAAVGFNEISDILRNNNGNVNTQGRRDLANDPAYSLGSQYFDPSIDPSLNPGFNL